MGTISSSYAKSEKFWQACRDNTMDFYEYYHDPKLNVHHKKDRAFRMACQYGHAHLVSKLLDTTFFHVNVHAVNEYAFRWACIYGHTDVVKILLKLEKDREIDINIFNEEAFRSACEFGHLEIVKLLLSIKDHRRVKINTNESEAFRLACQNGHIDVVRLLLRYNIDVSARDNYAILKAIQYNRVKIINLLLDDPRLDLNKSDVHDELKDLGYDIRSEFIDVNDIIMK